MPKTRWDHVKGSGSWNRAAYKALMAHGKPLIQTVPRDIRGWCPGYPEQDARGRAHFWMGFLSALAKHESTYRNAAVGGGGLWYGLVQILPDTARRYGCRARTGAALKDGGNNLSCAVRILAVTVPRDGVVHAHDKRWRGVSADWGPMRKESKREEMRRWVSAQDYCRPHRVPSPPARPQQDDIPQAPEMTQADPETVDVDQAGNQ